MIGHTQDHFHKQQTREKSFKGRSHKNNKQESNLSLTHWISCGDDVFAIRKRRKLLLSTLSTHISPPDHILVVMIKYLHISQEYLISAPQKLSATF